MAQIATPNTNTTIFMDHHDAATVERLAGFVGKAFKYRLRGARLHPPT